VPLSKQHHAALILAQLLKKDAPIYKGLPTDLAGKSDYATLFYENELKQHFYQEENVVITKVRGLFPGLDKLCDEIESDHKEITALFEAMKDSDDKISLLDKIGHRMEAHIRFEERKFFPLIQELCDQKTLASIESELSE
jgi:iron-sulfur cluster repair protein YtfE (RIC family)